MAKQKNVSKRKEFDPYHKWLGIPPEEQPADYYRLLGLKQFEADSDVIDAAANRQMAYVKQCGTGSHSSLSQKILNELSIARLTLLNSEKKAKYDLRLQAKQQRTGGPPAEMIPNIDVAETPKRPSSIKKMLPTLVGIVLAAAIFVTAAVVKFPGMGNTEQIQQDNQTANLTNPVEQQAGDEQPMNETQENNGQATEDQPKQPESSDKTASTKTADPEQDKEADDNTIDVLKEIDLYRDAVLGEWTLYNGVLIASPAEGRSKQIKLPVAVPEAYVLEIEAEGLQAGDPLTIGLVGGSSRFMASFNFQENPQEARATGLGLLNDKAPNNNETTHRQLLFQGPKTTLRFTVRKTSVEVICDGEQIINWSGDLARFSLDRKWKLNDDVALFLGPSTKQVRYTKVAFKPLKTNTPSPSPTPDSEQVVDLLRMIDLDRDVKAGMWEWNDQKELVNGSSDGAIVVFPYSAPDEYDITLHTTKIQGEDALGIGVTVGGQRCMLMIDSMNNTSDGVTQLDNRVDHPDVKLAQGPFFRLDKESVVVCEIRNSSVRALFDGKEIITWQGDPKRLSMPPGTDKLVGPGPEIFLVTNNSTYKFSRATLSPAKSARPNLTQTPTTLPSTPVETVAAKKPFPKKAKQDEAESLIKELFQSDYADTKSADGKLALARKLLAQAIRSTNEPVARYVMLREARELSINAGNAGTALDAITEMASDYEFDIWEAREDAVGSTMRRARSVGQSRALINATVPMINLAVEADQFEVASKLATMMVTAGRKVRDKGLSDEIAKLRSQVLEMRKEFEEAEEAAVVLKETPDDPQANFVRGSYLCLVRNDWQQGLPMLAKSDDEQLQKVVQLDLTNPEAGDKQSELADAWWDWIESTRRKENERFRVAAHYWYRKAASGVSGLAKLKVDQRLKEIGEVPLPRLGSFPTASTGAQTPKSPRMAPIQFVSQIERDAATWALDAGAKVGISIQGQERELSASGDLPDEPFFITSIKFSEPNYSTGKDDPISGDDLNQIARLSGIRTLVLNWIYLGDDAISHLSGLSKLQELQVSGCGITDAGLETIGKMTQLKVLLLGYSTKEYRGNITSDGLIHLKNLTNLTKLDIGASLIEDSGVRHLKSMAKLEYLSLYATKTTDASLVFLEGLEKLNHVVTAGTQITKSDLDAFWANHKQPNSGRPSASASPQFDPAAERAVAVRILEHGGFINVKMNGKEVRVQDESAIPAEPFAVSYISTNRSKKIVDEDMALIAKCSDLEQLSLGHSSITDAGLRYLPPLSSLKVLNLDNLDVSDEGMKSLRNLTTLENLALVNAKVTDEGLKELSGLRNLRSLILYNTKVSDAGLRHLNQMTALETLYLTGTKVTGSGLPDLPQLPALTKLDLSKTPLDDAGLSHVTRFKNLKYLIFSYSNVTSSGLPHVRELPELLELSIDDLNLTDDDLKNLAGLTNLIKVRLNANPITDSGIVHLYNLKKLKHLVIQKTKVSEQGVNRLQQILPDCEIFQ